VFREDTKAYNVQVISFIGLPIGQKVIELHTSDYESTNEMAKIKGYKIEYCRNKMKINGDGNSYAIEEDTIEEDD
jgi:hypothetical protein